MGYMASGGIRSACKQQSRWLPKQRWARKRNGVRNGIGFVAQWPFTKLKNTCTHRKHDLSKSGISQNIYLIKVKEGEVITLMKTNQDGMNCRVWQIQSATEHRKKKECSGKRKHGTLRPWRKTSPGFLKSPNEDLCGIWSSRSWTGERRVWLNVKLVGET